MGEPICCLPKEVGQIESMHLQVIDDILPCLNKARYLQKLILHLPFGTFSWMNSRVFLLPSIHPLDVTGGSDYHLVIKVSSEIFQKHLNQVLEGLVGVVCIADDIVVYRRGETMGEAQRDHDDNPDQPVEEM